MRFWSSFRYHLFLLISLLGCIAPWVTPRYFESGDRVQQMRNPPWLPIAIVNRRAGPGELPATDADLPSAEQWAGSYALPYSAPGYPPSSAGLPEQSAGALPSSSNQFEAAFALPASDRAGCMMYLAGF